MERQKIVESNGQSWLLVAPPESDDEIVALEINYNQDKLVCWYDGYFVDIDLKFPGSYILYGKGSDLSEEQWRERVETIMPFGRVKRYKDYEYPESGFYKATESGLSLLTHHGFKPNGCVILKVLK